MYRWLIPVTVAAGGALLAVETRGFEPRREAICPGNRQEKGNGDAEPGRNQAVELFEQFLHEGLRVDRAKLESGQLDALEHRIAAIDLICKLTDEQKRKIQLADALSH